MIHLRWNSISKGFMKEIWEVGELWLRNHIYQIKLLQLCYFWTKIYLSWPQTLLLTHFRIYQLYLSSQSSVLAVILNQAIHQRALNPYQQIISEKATTTPSFVTTKAFSFVISFISLLSILLSFTLLSFTLYQI